jgi:hypothetical protein
MSIPITENQFLAITNASSALCPSDRDQFMASVAHELAGKPVGDGAVARAIAAAFKVFFHPPEAASHPGRWDHDRPSRKAAALHASPDAPPGKRVDRDGRQHPSRRSSADAARRAF